MQKQSQATETAAPRRTELLAPAGGPESAYAAFQYGADAIYCGLRKFSARAEAVNFSLDELDAVTAFAHAQTPRRRVFVTVNTVTLEAELPGLVEALANLVAIGVDAVIVQDLGVARLMREQFPQLEMHASTQMAIHNVAGARQAKALGFARVTMARELTLAEIRRVAAEAGVETEVFVHGALCYAYSGLCFFSSHLCGRSGNRGRCAYPCRDLFTPVPAAAAQPAAPVPACGSGGLLFSMKDLALAEGICDLRQAGVACFKIEGRMKGPLYVAAVTDFYRRLLDGRMSAAELPQAAADLQTIFSRPWTDLYLRKARHDGVVDTQWVGHRGVPVGKVEKVIRLPREVPLLRFRTDREIELHDGLQLDLPGVPKPFGFAVDELRLPGQRPGTAAGGRRLFHVAAGQVVDVPLPPDAPSLPSGTTVYCASSQVVKKRFVVTVPKPGLYRRRRALHVVVEFRTDGLTAAARVAPDFAGDIEAAATVTLPGVFSAARQTEGLEAAVRGAFDKLGDTAFALASLELRNPQQLFAPVSQLNELRRQVTAALTAELQAALRRRIEAVRSQALGPAVASPAVPVPESWSIRTDNAACLAQFEAADWQGINEVVLDISRLPLARVEQGIALVTEHLGQNAVRLALPVITRSWEEEPLRQRLRALATAGWRKWLVPTLAGFEFLAAEVQPRLPPGVALDLAADWTLFTFNALTVADLAARGVTDMTLSPEDGQGNMQALLAAHAARLRVILYQDTPLFISESCAFASQAGHCEGPTRCRVRAQGLAEPGSNAVTLRAGKGGEYLLLSDACRTVVVNRAPFSLTAHVEALRQAGARRFRVDYVWRHYTAQEALEVWRRVRRGLPVASSNSGTFGGSI